MLYKKKTYRIDMDAANAALQNIFAACDEKPNTVPFDKLVLRQTARTKPFDTLLIILTIVLVLTILTPLPFLYFQPATDYSNIELSDYYTKDNKLYLQLDAGAHTIKFEEAYLVTPSGSIYEFVSYDAAKQSLCFPYVTMECNIYIPYDNDSVLHLQLTPTELKENRY